MYVQIKSAERKGEFNATLEMQEITATLSCGKKIDLCAYKKHIGHYSKKGWEIKFHKEDMPTLEKYADPLGVEKVTSLLWNTSVNSSNTLGGHTPHDFVPY